MKFKIIVFAFAFVSLAFSQDVIVEAFDEQQNQYANLYAVPFKPNPETAVVLLKGGK